MDLISFELLKSLAASFIIGAICVSTLTVTADRFGSKLAGALGGFPATVATSLFFIGHAGSPEKAGAATTVIPLLMGFYGVLITVYVALLPRGLFVATVPAIVAWIILSSLPVFFGTPSFAWSVAIFVGLLIGAYLVTEFAIRIPSRGGGKVSLSLQQLAVRMVTGGSVVALSVYLGSVTSETLGGIMATFPAVTLATLLVTYQSGGSPLSQAVGKSILLSGMINVTAYAAAVRLFYPTFGIVIGTVLACLCALVCCLMTYLTLRRITA